MGFRQDYATKVLQDDRITKQDLSSLIDLIPKYIFSANFLHYSFENLDSKLIFYSPFL